VPVHSLSTKLGYVSRCVEGVLKTRLCLQQQFDCLQNLSFARTGSESSVKFQSIFLSGLLSHSRTHPPVQGHRETWQSPSLLPCATQNMAIINMIEVNDMIYPTDAHLS
ncbi:unnamed protein product, partial [Ectocarpus fasciculatus]